MNVIKESSHLDWEGQYMEQLANPTFGPSFYGGKLHINDELRASKSLIGKCAVIDVETDEKDGFVGIALTTNGLDIFYYTHLGADLRYILETYNLIGHNVKFDLKQLVGWGVGIKPEQMYADTCLMSYVINTTKESHGLKDLAKEMLQMNWPSYKEMVGSGKKKQTLDKQEVGRVATYCGMDCLATYRLYQLFLKKMTPIQKHLLETIELPTARILMEMELKGVQLDVPYLRELDTKFKTKLNELESELHRQWHLYVKGDEVLNPNSNLQIANLLKAQGAVLPRTKKGNEMVNKQVLQQWTHLPAVPTLLEYSKIEKLISTYTTGLLEAQKDGIVYCNFNQISRNDKGTEVGISTGRLSSSNPNLQNIPTHTEEGKMIEAAFIPREGHTFAYFDFSQIEPRLTGHFSKDPFWMEVYNNNRDVYEELVKGTGRSRQDGKTFQLALLYGAQPKKLASVFKCSEAEAEQILQQIWKKLPKTQAWIYRTIHEAKQKGGVFTLHKRFIPLPGLKSNSKWERMHWERVAVNAIIQGSAAEIMKLSLIALKKAGYLPVLTVHDSFLIEINENLENMPQMIQTASDEIKQILEGVVKLDIPLKISTGSGNTWAESKED